METETSTIYGSLNQCILTTSDHLKINMLERSKNQSPPKNIIQCIHQILVAMVTEKSKNILNLFPIYWNSTS